MSRSSDPLRISPNDPLRELFEACKSGDVIRVRAMVDSSNVNARDTAGRRSTPLHFAAGNSQCGHLAIFLSLRFHVKSNLAILGFH